MQKNKGKHISDRYRIVKQIGEGLLTEYVKSILIYQLL